jgi:SsrA-binding protein
MDATKLIARNKKAFFNYEVVERCEAGVALVGTEVKSVKDGRISFPDAWAEIKDGEVYLNAFLIAENPFSSVFNHDPARPKKHLLHRD